MSKSKAQAKPDPEVQAQMEAVDGPGMISVKEAVERYTLENRDYKEVGDLYAGITDGLVIHEKPEGAKRGIKVDYESAAKYLANPPASKPRVGKIITTESLKAQFEKKAGVAVRQKAYIFEKEQMIKFHKKRYEKNIVLLNTITDELHKRDEEVPALPEELVADCHAADVAESSV